jgi:hypothetical protein
MTVAMGALLGQYFLMGTDLRVHSQEHLAAVADKLNSRPRKTLRWKTPPQQLTVTLYSSTRCVTQPGGGGRADAPRTVPGPSHSNKLSQSY